MKLLCFVVIVCIIVMGACNSFVEPLPTLAIMPTDEATLTSSPLATLTAQLPRATPQPRSTLPPTFTPSPEASGIDTSFSTNSQSTATTFISATNVRPQQRAECVNFKVDIANSDVEFEIGQAPLAQWSAITNTASYHLILGDDTGAIIRDDIYIAETSYTFDASLFTVGKAYAWTVIPIAANGEHICTGIGSEMIPQSGN